MNEKGGIICPVCGNKETKIWTRAIDREYRTSEEEYTFYKCGKCVTLFLCEFPVNKLQEIYPSNYYSFVDQKKSIASHVKEYFDKLYFKKILRRFKNRPINILDIGGGSGWLIDIIARIYSNINVAQVVDIDENAKMLAEEKGYRFHHGPIETFESDIQFDLVLMLNLIEHISDPRDTLNKIEKQLSSEGMILIKTPNVDSLDARLYRHKYWGGLHCPRHWILFSQNSFKKMIEETKLKVAHINYTQGAPFWTSSLLISWQDKGWINITQERPVMFHPLTPLFHMIFAGVDFVRGTFGARTSQMFIELEKETK